LAPRTIRIALEGVSAAQQSKIDAEQAVIREQNDKIIALEQRLAPRVISEAQSTELIAKLKPFAGTEFDAAAGAIQDREQMSLLQSMMSILVTAGWIQVDWRYASGGLTYNFGVGNKGAGIGSAIADNVEIQLRSESFDRLKPSAATLIGALRGIGIEAVARVVDATTINNTNVQAMHLVVGQKR
jgi:hypothetical protein